MTPLTTTALRPAKRPTVARAPRPMTLEKFLHWKPEDGYKYELVNSQIEKTKCSLTAEQTYLVRNLTRRFMQTQAFAEGSEMVSEMDSTLGPSHVRRPDVALISAQQIKASAFGEPFLPTFAVEIISKNDNINKVREKLEAYFKSGVQVVWHIFPSLQKVDVYTSPNRVTVLEGDEICSAAPALTDFDISVNGIFKI